MEGTNNEEEAYLSFNRSGAESDYVHVNELKRGLKSLEDYDGAIIPGGFSAGDYVRGGAIFAARLHDSSKNDLKNFVDAGKPLIGVCNGFQVLTELGLIPDLDGKMNRSVTLTFNTSNRFECRFTYMKRVGESRIFGKSFGRDVPFQVPVAHSEGKIVIKEQEKNLKKLEENDQILFKYSNREGTSDDYPWNPNGSVGAIASLANPEGNVIGLMPHPERVYYGFQSIGEERNLEYGTGKLFYDSIVGYMRETVLVH